MKNRTRTIYTAAQKDLMWERWKMGDSLHQIARLFDRHLYEDRRHTSATTNSICIGTHFG